MPIENTCKVKVTRVISKNTVFKGLTREWSLDNTLVMGILNVTPDSFSDGGLNTNKDTAVSSALRMVDEGAHIIDVGGESSRPGSDSVSEEEELKRVIPVIEELSKKGIQVSVDTTKSKVAEKAIEAGAEIVNDISALTFDSEMAEVVSRTGAGVVLMHMRGNPKTMQAGDLDKAYADVVGEVKSYLKDRIDFAQSKGIKKEKIAIDPGIGFGKSVEGNLRLIKELKSFCDLGVPVLLGASRKSFIGAVTGLDVGDRVAPSVAVALIGVMNGASIVRVHDVRETVGALKVLNEVI